MKIVAFLLSPSQAKFHEGTAQWIIDRYTEDLDYHRKILKETMTGRRLYEAFGNLYDEIVWDNISPLVNNDSPDQKHICSVIEKHKPDLILTFGEIAKTGLVNCTAAFSTPLLHFHHPNARYRTQSDLNDCATIVRAKIQEEHAYEKT